MNTAESIQAIDSSIEVGIGADSGTDQYLTFILAGEEYGVDILRVQEIKGWDTVTPIPNTPEFIKGVINLRGTIVPIIDLRQRFGLDSIPYGPMTVVIMLKVITNDAERVMGVVVDAVSEVYNVADGEMQPTPDFGTVVSVDYVQGLATVDGKMVIVLDIDHLLTNGVMNEIDASAQ